MDVRATEEEAAALSAAAPEPQRVILHLDLDAFYAQVEQRRLGIDRSVPLAVQQWQALIAVSYAARARGVSRVMQAAEARKHCPELVLVHTEILDRDGRKVSPTCAPPRRRPLSELIL